MVSIGDIRTIRTVSLQEPYDYETFNLTRLKELCGGDKYSGRDHHTHHKKYTREIMIPKYIDYASIVDNCTENVCLICLEAESDRSKLYKFNNCCNCSFHKDCMLTWINMENKIKCPSCRENKDKLYNLFVKKQMAKDLIK